MADPTPYSRDFSFTDFQTSTPQEPLPGLRVDVELDTISGAIAGLVGSVTDIRRSDGKLKNGIVNKDALSADFSVGFTLRGTWASGVAYAVGDGIIYAQKFYKALVAHTSDATTPNAIPATWLYLFDLVGSVPTDLSVTTAKLVDRAVTSAKIAGGVLPFATRAAAIAATIGAEISFVNLAGYAVAGDGGDALYARLGAAPSPVKAWHFQSADGGYWQLTGTTVNVRALGALGNDSTNDAAAFQAAASYSETFGAVVYVPTGVYRISSGIVITNPNAGSLYNKRVRFVGDGPALSVIRPNGAITAISVTETFGVNDEIRQPIVSGIGFVQVSGTHQGVGIYLKNMGYARLDDVQFQGLQYGLQANDVICAEVYRPIAVRNGTGIRLEYGTSTRPNAWRIVGPILNTNDNYGIWAQQACLLMIDGGTIESNGLGGTGERAGIKFEGSVIDGAKGLVLRGMYLQANYGDADILINHTGTSTASHSITDCDFARVSNTNFVTNHVYINKTGSGHCHVVWRGCSYTVSGYVPDPSRRVVQYSASDTNYLFDHDHTNYGWAAAEAPSLIGASSSGRKNVSAWCRMAPATGAIIKAHNVASVTKVGTGKFRFNFAKPLKGTGPCTTATVGASPGVAIVAIEDPTYVEVWTYNMASVLTDFDLLNVQVTDEDGSLV